MNLEALGREAGRLLLAMIGGEKSRGIRRLPCTLVVRGSSKAGPNETVRHATSRRAEGEP